jgi:LacI family transcriptional regulator
MAITLKDIAKECGVSVYAVSRVLNNKPIYLKDEKRKLIKKTAKRLNYAPNFIAQSLQSKTSNTVGLILNFISDPFHVRLINQLDLILSQENYSLLVSTSGYSFDNELQQIRLMKSRACDFIMISSRFDTVTDADRLDEYLELVSGDKKIFFIDSILPSDEINFVTTDNYTAAYKAAKIFIEKGIKDFCFVKTHLGLKVIKERLKGFSDACGESSGVSLDVFEIRNKSNSLLINDFLKKVSRGTLFFFESLSVDFAYFLDFFKELDMKIGQDCYVSGFDSPSMKNPFDIIGEYKNVIVNPVPFIEQNRDKFVETAIDYFKNIDSISNLMHKKIEPDFINFDGFSL